MTAMASYNYGCILKNNAGMALTGFWLPSFNA